MFRFTSHQLHRQLAKATLLLLLIFTAAGVAAAQTDASNGGMFPRRGEKNDDQPKSVKDFLAKQRAEKAKKDHEELLNRGDELILLTRQLESAFARNKELTSSDRAKLESVEKLVTRIRKGLGGDGDDEDEGGADWQGEDATPGTLQEAFAALKQRTAKLVDELKKTSRFTISALAIQSSNSVLKIVRFLRLRR